MLSVNIFSVSASVNILHCQKMRYMVHTCIHTRTQFFQQLDLVEPTVVLSIVVPFYDPIHEHGYYCHYCL